MIVKFHEATASRSAICMWT